MGLEKKRNGGCVKNRRQIIGAKEKPVGPREELTFLDSARNEGKFWGRHHILGHNKNIWFEQQVPEAGMKAR